MMPRSAVLSIALQARRIASVVVAASVAGVSMAVLAFLMKVFMDDLAEMLRKWFLRDLMTSFLTDLILGTNVPPLNSRVYPTSPRKRKRSAAISPYQRP